MTGIYLHIPFCAVKCPYCDFFSSVWHRETADAYIGAIVRNLAAYALQDTVDSVYFGGGTPSLLSVSQIARVLDACAAHLHLSDDAEITLEMNPAGEHAAYLRELRAAGVNRLSVGTQSFSDAQLRLLGRRHTAQDGQNAILTAYAQGFQNISCDLMLACPAQTEEVLGETLETLAQLPVTHVSAYLLQVEPGTPLSRDQALLSQCPDDDAAAGLYLQTVRTLASFGLHQYEISSFARKGYESRHNLKYWHCEPYLGIGAGAHSCLGGRRFCVPKDIAAFCAAPVQTEETLCEAAPEDRILLGLRLSEGIPLSWLSAAAQKKLPALAGAGYLTCVGERVALTPEGSAVSNAVIAALLV